MLMGGYVLGTNKEPQKPNDSLMLRVRATSTFVSVPTITHTTLNYTACDIMKDIYQARHLPSYICYKSTTSIYSWSFNTWVSDIPFTSSVTFGDESPCTGYCTPAQAGVWVYTSEKDTLDAYNIKSSICADLYSYHIL